MSPCEDAPIDAYCHVTVVGLVQMHTVPTIGKQNASQMDTNNGSGDTYQEGKCIAVFKPQGQSRGKLKLSKPWTNKE